ncbi:hypothetical protein [Denitromonas iodatirespirans]|uniref:Uncharacterized protein n=1 Tax=Denitromonas iodatirespirans TaxID=2795389 RepID=A0A944DJK9_DENI1|nr:hypothetical protein [Denitromonas iodatirespirans]MBT0964128.1 hypothetical protein [Denitromonas iodatirespirans]
MIMRHALAPTAGQAEGASAVPLYNGQNSGINTLAASQVMRFIGMPRRARSAKN